MSRTVFVILISYLAGLALACSDDSSGTAQEAGVASREAGPGVDVAMDQRVTGADQRTATVDQKTTKVDQRTSTGGGFGSGCSQTKPCADAGMVCLAGLGGSTAGYCTKKCPTAGEDCTGVPAGKRAICLAYDGAGQYYCAFACQVSDDKYPCPSDLTCLLESGAAKLCVPQ